MTKSEYHSWLVKRGVIRDTTPVPIPEDVKPPEHALVIDNFAFPLPKGVPDPEWAVHNAMDALVAIMRHRPPTAMIEKYGLRPKWQDWMMFLLPHVAKHYEVSRYAVLDKFFKEWGPSMMCGREVPIFGYVPGEPIMSQVDAVKQWERRHGRDPE